MLSFQMCSKVNHIFSNFFSTIGYHKLLVTIPCARQQIRVYLFYVLCYSHTLNLSFPSSFSPLINMFIFYVWESISVSYLDLFIFFFQISHISGFIQYPLYGLLHKVWYSVGPLMLLQMTIHTHRDTCSYTH